MNNTEVGNSDSIYPSNDIRLAGSVQPEAQRGDSAYHHLNMIQSTPLDAMDTAGVVGIPTIAEDSTMTGITKSASVTGPTGEVETTYDHANLSAKYKYPNVTQDVPSLGKPNVQYNDHS